MVPKPRPQDEDLPPPYSQQPEPGVRFSQFGDASLVHAPFDGQLRAHHGQRNEHELRNNGSALTSHLVSQLASVSQRIRDTREVRHAQQAQSDILLLDLIVPAIESFFADLGALDGVPPLAALTIVPSAAVSPDAVLSGTEDMARRGEISQVARIDTNRQNKANDSKRSSLPSSTLNEDSSSWSTGHEFDDGWGRWGESDNSSGSSQKSLWWRDEAMARRLAAYLQPPTPEPKPQPTVPVLSTTVQEAVERQIPAEKQRKKSWGWGRRTNNRSSLSDITSEDASSTSLGGGQAGTVAGGDVFGVSQTSIGAVVPNEPNDEMHVKAEEVAFRRENDFGIWESMSGFGVVVTVRLQS